MTADLTTTTCTTPARLHDLAERIAAEHTACESAARDSLAHAHRAGELLLEAKREVGHGEWLPWLRDNCAFAERTAQLYMRIARRWAEVDANPQRVADLTLRQVAGLLADRHDECEVEAPKPEPMPWDREDNAAFLPEPGRALVCADDSRWGVIEESLESPGFYRIALCDSQGALACGRKPVRADAVAWFLECLATGPDYRHFTDPENWRAGSFGAPGRAWAVIEPFAVAAHDPLVQ